MYFPVERVAVCALKFVPQLASIAVGFNFGSFQVSSVVNQSSGMAAMSASCCDFTQP